MSFVDKCCVLYNFDVPRIFLEKILEKEDGEIHCLTDNGYSPELYRIVAKRHHKAGVVEFTACLEKDYIKDDCCHPNDVEVLCVKIFDERTYKE